MSLHRELELLVKAGLSPAETTAAATSRATAFLGLIDEVGTIEPGKRADLVLLDRDPLADITNTRRIAAVGGGAMLRDRAELRGLVAGQSVRPTRRYAPTGTASHPLATRSTSLGGR